MSGLKSRDKGYQITEEQFQDQIFDLAHHLGYKVAHFRPARTKYGWTTAVSADGKGFPDTVLAKEGRPVIIAEIKREGSKLSPEQEKWINLLKQVPNIQVFVWYPSDFEDIVKCLRGEERG